MITNSTRHVGVDLRCSRTIAVVYDADFRSLARRQDELLPRQGFDATIDQIARTIKRALDTAGVSPREIASIGVGTPGSLDLDQGVILEFAKLGLSNAPLANALSTVFDRPVALANDVDLRVYAEYQNGAARDDRCVLGVFPEADIGGGCVYEGNLMRGRRSPCMEIGHIPVMPDGPECGCGATGCLEAVSSQLAIAAASARAALSGQAPWLLKHAGSAISRMRSSMIADSVRHGDAAVEKIVRRAARAIGIALAGLIHVISPDTIILGGSLVDALPDIYLQEVEMSVRERILPSFRDGFRVTTAVLGNDATALGAAIWSAKCELSASTGLVAQG